MQQGSNIRLLRVALERYKTNWFGPRGTKPEPKAPTEEEQRKDLLRWSLRIDRQKNTRKAAGVK